jgi:SWI/SNF-related matrix-associated actin-dependent regulator 1 of chromatin subfamily A
MIFFGKTTPKFWGTYRPEIAYRFRNFADPELVAELEAMTVEKVQTIANSRATDSDIEIPIPQNVIDLHQDYLPFQKAGVAYASQRPNTLIADEMGLGKTIQAIGTITLDPTINKILVVVPAFLKINWGREIKKWLTRPLTIGTASSDYLPDTDIVVTNYDILSRNPDQLRSIKWDLIVVDEAHYVKNYKAQRTVFLVGGELKIDPEEVSNFTLRGYKIIERSKFCKVTRKTIPEYFVVMTPIPSRKKIALTGTPILNRPIELWTTVNWLFPHEFSNFMYFAKRYCGAYQTRFGWDFTGATNTDELALKLRSLGMIRRLKSDVLKELPSKFYNVIPLPVNGSLSRIVEESEQFDKAAEIIDLAALKDAVEAAKTSDDPEDLKEALEALENGFAAIFSQLSAIRRDTAKLKLPYIIEHITNLIENGVKVICFCHHREIVEAIHSAFKGSVKAYGGMTPKDRDAAEQEFQNNEDCRLFTGTYDGAGVGLTLTAGSRVVLAELEWVPAKVSQAIDRAHRYGQKNNVIVDYMVFENSVDSMMAEMLIEKQRVADSILDVDLDPVDTTAIEVPVQEFPAINLEAVAIPEPRAEKAEYVFTEEDIKIILYSLSSVAGTCDGARQEDGLGFNKFDSAFGKDLASLETLSPRQATAGIKLALKYKGQLSADLVEKVDAISILAGLKKAPKVSSRKKRVDIA